MGTAPLGNLYTEVPDEQARAALDTAWKLGVRYFDTAPHYGLGLAERRLGGALAEHTEGAVVSTKVGRLLEPWPAGADVPPDDLADGFAVPATARRVFDYSRDGVRRSVEESLRRLGRDRIDLALVHDPDDHMDEALATAFPALAELRDEGVVGAIGTGMNDAAKLARLVEGADIDAVLCAGRYTLLEQGALDALLPACERRGTSVVIGGVYNSGLLASPEPPADATYNYAAAPPELLERARRIAAVCAAHGVTLPQAAVQFVQGHPAVAAVLVGVRSAAEAEAAADAFAARVPAALWAQLREQGLIREDAPPPGPEQE
ncbi:aldo/keto reductase [Mangrovactinospora gilvigrisea]|uniref:Aldo/keto reductase n=1 Tax=Mangrovactinospora gilvigrisea TaxID=1428644 RepID=A0A1J7BSK6_9ACTN|nr:aldo/keto reductase [Mangrovactinospora gilvigrisea]OIV36441.1 aldo/keto reductase [Mangrovactinospora gilvigrisea]